MRAVPGDPGPTRLGTSTRTGLTVVSPGRLVTFGTGLAALHADVAVLLDGAAG